MSIEEKKKPLEFEFVDENFGNIVYNITYEPDGRMQPIVIECGGKAQSFSINFFEEVVDFLKSKGILKNKMNIRGDSSVEKHSIDMGGSLPIPQVEILDKSSVDNSIAFSDTDPLASFDISLTTEPILQDGAIGKKIVSEVINRPVIKSRISEEDPMSAEKDAAAIRGKGKDGEKKSIKRVND